MRFKFKRLLKGAILGLLIGVIIGGIISLFSLTDEQNYAIKDNLSKSLYSIFIMSTLPIFLFGIVLGFINSLRKSKKERLKIISILKWIIAFIITIVLFINIIDILPEIKSKECWYIMDEVSDSCDEAYKKWESEGGLDAGDLTDCVCKQDDGFPLFVGDKFYDFQVDEDIIKKECVYHKECKEIEETYSPKKIEQYKEKDIRNINVDIDSPSVIRQGSNITLILRIINVNKKTDIFIKNIKFLDSNKKVVENFEINTTFNPIGKEINSMNKMFSRMTKSPIFYYFYMFTYYKNFEKIANKMSSNSFQQSFREDLRKFSDSWVVGKNVIVFIEIEVNYDNKNYVVKEEHSILISGPLPSPPHD